MHLKKVIVDPEEERRALNQAVMEMAAESGHLQAKNQRQLL